MADDEPSGFGLCVRPVGGGQGGDLDRQQAGEDEDSDTEVVVPSQDDDPDESEHGDAEQRPRFR